MSTPNPSLIGKKSKIININELLKETLKISNKIPRTKTKVLKNNTGNPGNTYPMGRSSSSLMSLDPPYLSRSSASPSYASPSSGSTSSALTSSASTSPGLSLNPPPSPSMFSKLFYRPSKILPISGPLSPGSTSSASTSPGSTSSVPLSSGPLSSVLLSPASTSSGPPSPASSTIPPIIKSILEKNIKINKIKEIKSLIKNNCIYIDITNLIGDNYVFPSTMINFFDNDLLLKTIIYMLLSNNNDDKNRIIYFTRNDPSTSPITKYLYVYNLKEKKDYQYDIS